MDIALGSIDITEKQASRLSDLKSDTIKGFSFWLGQKIVAVTTRALTDQEIENLKTAIQALPDEYSQEYYSQAFNLVLFQSDLAALLPTLSNPDLRWEFAALNTYATNKDFAGIAWYMNFLYAAGAATADDITAVNALLTKQGIIVDA